MRGKRRKNFEIVRWYIEKFLRKFNKAERSIYEAKRLSYKERRVNALAPRAEERRDKLRKATGRSKYLLIRGYLNEGTQQVVKDLLSMHE